MRALMLLAALLVAAPAAAGEQDIVLKEGQGRDLVAANCQICHSLDYIEINSPFLDQKQWQATVTKMIERYGAPIEPDECAGDCHLSQHQLRVARDAVELPRQHVRGLPRPGTLSAFGRLQVP